MPATNTRYNRDGEFVIIIHTGDDAKSASSNQKPASYFLLPGGSVDPSTRAPALAEGSCSGFRPTGVLEGATGLPVGLHRHLKD